MDYKHFKYNDTTVDTAVFDSGRIEAHAMIHVSPQLPFEEQLKRVEYASRAIEKDLGGLQTVFKRYFLSDAANQAELLPEDEKCAVSRIQQPPLDGSKIALWLVLQKDPDFRYEDNGVWHDSKGRIIVGDGEPLIGDSHDVTTTHLSRLSERLENAHSSLLDGCLRTWFMVHDVDHNYWGVVTGRNEEFERRGLTRHTHFISSTGIGGSPVSKGEIVAFNAVCDTKLKPHQMGFVYGSSHLNPTAEYGVAFERGTYVDYADRRKVYISGTASIDNKGEVVHPGNVEAQTQRMLENIEVLLAEAGCDGNDIAHLNVYLRDIADATTVNAIFDKKLPGVPRVVVLAPVCRPGWLVETECIAIKKKRNPQYAEF